ncbi:hypothetical protein Cylst_1631 [Cylindrospermum stagnale PCC 7417]|uniref:Tox-REase-3 domain-containing protein n=1 Tax=Cylindrospermum stagnale PCC 7417 TaxID=56107 RepID=K9WVQ9_9NOST|nr:restriction endonuclease fold toxin [Cylindrospermum stagnale]AFZ23909.1 hypothetical protein Cylst_1631 [Cylindrospermum stagnale PCC 7417]
MYSKQHRTSKNSANSSDTPAPNQFAPRRFVVQPKTEEVTPQQEQTPDSEAQREETEQYKSGFIDFSKLTPRPSPARTPRIQMKLTLGEPGTVYQQQAVPPNPVAIQPQTNPDLSPEQNTTLEPFDKVEEVANEAVEIQRLSEPGDNSDEDANGGTIQRACSDCEAEQEDKKHTGTIQAKKELSGFNQNLFKPSLLNKPTDTLQAKTIEEQTSKTVLNNNKNEFSLTKKPVNHLPAKEISKQDYQPQNKLESGKTEVLNAVQLVQSQTNNPLIQKQPTDPRPQGTNVSKSGVAFYEAGLELYNQPSKGHGSSIIRKIPIGTKLFIDKQLSSGWYHIALSSGEYGYVEATKVNTRLPEPGAQLYKIKSGENAIAIAERYYKQFVQRDRDLRFYVNVLEEINRLGGGIHRPPNSSWQNTQATAGVYIWIPSAEFANSFVGKISTGSPVRDALAVAGNVAKTVGNFAVGGAALVAGLLQGALESIWSNLVGIKDLAVMVWDILKSLFTGNILNDGQNLWKQITQINWGDLAQAWLGDFEKQWNNPAIFQKWQFRGKVLGYAAAEIALAVLTAGGATGAKWVGKMSTKAIEVVKKIPGVAKLAEKAKTIKIPAAVKKGLKNANTAKWLSKHRNNVIKKYGADGIKMLSEGVIAKRVTRNGHTLKVLANGKIVRCSTCEELAKQFAKELADPKNSKLAEQLSGLQKKAVTDPEGVVDEIIQVEKQLQDVRKNNLVPKKRSGEEIGKAGKDWEEAVQKKTGGKSAIIEGREIDSVTDEALIQAKNINTSNPKNFLNKKTRTQIKETIRLADERGKRAEFWFKEEPHPLIREYIENKRGIVKVGL